MQTVNFPVVGKYQCIREAQIKYDMWLRERSTASSWGIWSGFIKELALAGSYLFYEIAPITQYIFG